MTDVPFKGSDNIEVTGHFNTDLGRLDAALTRCVNLANEDRLVFTTMQGDMALARADIAALLSSFNTAETDIPHFALDKTSDITRSTFDFTDTADHIIVGQVSGQTTRVHRWVVTAFGAVDLSIYDGPSATGTLIHKLLFPAAGAYVFTFDPRPYLITSANKDLTFKASAAVRIGGTVSSVTSA